MFEYEGQELSVEDIEAVASKAGMSYEDTLKALTDKGMVDKSKQEKQENDLSFSQRIQLGLAKAGAVDPTIRTNLSILSSFAKGTIDIADSAFDLAEAAVQMSDPMSSHMYFAKRRAAAMSDMTYDEFEKQMEDPFNVVDLSRVSNFLDQSIIKFKDDKGKQLDYTELIEQGKLADAATSFVMETAGAAPSLLVSMLPGGYSLLGGTSFIDKLNTDLVEKPDETLGQIIGNAVIYGGSDAVGEFFGGRFLRNMVKGVVPKPGAKIPGDVRDAMVGGVGGVVRSIFKGGGSEFLQESITSVIQSAGDDLIYGDDVTASQYFRKALHAGMIGFALGGGTGTVSTLKNREDNEKFYEYLAPKSYKVQQVKLSQALEEAESDLKNAPADNKEIFQKKVDDIKNKKQQLKDQLYDRFQNMGLDKNEMQYYLDNENAKHKALDIITGGRKFSDQAKEQAKKDFMEAAQNNEDLFAVTDLNYDADVELELSKYFKLASDIDNRNKNLWFKASDLNYEYIDTQEKFDDLKKQYGKDIANQADGFFETTVDGKKKIFINRDVAAAAEATNVIGHELLHYAISNRFANDPEALKASVVAFTKYLDEVDPFIKKSIEKRLANPKNGYAKLDANGKVQRDENGLIVMNKESHIEEYFNMFSDLIDKKKIKAVEEASDGIKNSFRSMVRGLGGFNKVDFKNGQEVFNLLVDYNKNINREGLLGRVTQKKIIETVSGKKIQTRKAEDIKKSVSKDIDTELVKDTSFENKIQKLYQDPATWLEIEEAYKPRIKRVLRANYSWIEDLDKQNNTNKLDAVVEEAVGPSRGVLEMITKYDPKSGVPLSGYIGSIMKKRGLMEYVKREFPEGVIQQNLGAREDVQRQVAKVEAEQDIEADIETEDLSLVGQAKVQAKKTERQSKLRRQFGFETGGSMYNKVLSSAKKSVLLAYRKTQSITDPAKRARAIKDLLRKEYFTSGLTSDLFKDIKNFLGTKDYIKNLKQYREAIVESMSTADLVQIERKVPDNERIFTVFDKKLTKIEDVIDAVDKGLLPTEAINTIKKGTAVNLYRKRMPTEQELVSFADQPAINPVTGARSGLKGTRKDGFAKAISNTLVLDAVMEVRQSEDVVEALEDDAIAQLDLMALSDAVGREVDVKFSKSTAVADINNAVDNNINLAVYSQIKFSRSHREAYEARLTKKRTDLDEKQIKGAVESIFKFVEGDNIPNNKRAKYEKMAMHYMANGYLILPEDGYKVIEAERIATIKKIDPFSYKNPNLLIEKFAGEVKGARTNPDTVKEFTNKTDVGSGVTVYDVADSKEGQAAVRKVIDTHFGKKANPWCLAARRGTYLYTDEAFNKAEKDAIVETEEAKGHDVAVYEMANYMEGTLYEGKPGQTIESYEIVISEKADSKNELKESFKNWQNYNKEGNGFKIAFKNGKLLCFRDGNEKQWWDRNDKPSDKIHFTVTEKKGNVESVYDVTPEDGTKVLTKRTEGQMPTAKVYTRSEDANYIIESDVNYINGAQESARIETTYKDKKLSQGIGIYDGATPDIQINNVTNDVQTIKNNVKTSVYEGKVVLTSKQFKKFEDEVVKIEHVTNAQSSENISLTINGVKQDIDVKFSKSANDNLEGVKDLTKAQKQKVLQAILKEQVSIEQRLNTENEKLGDQTALVLLSEFEAAIETGISPLDAYNKILSKFPEGSANVSFKSPAEFVKYVKETTLPVIRQEGFRSLRKYLETKLKNAKPADRKKIVDSFIRDVGRSARTAKVFGITTNKALKEQVLDQVLSEKLLSQYELVEGRFRGETFKNVELYENIENIKNDVRSNSKLRGKVNRQAQEARDFIFEVLDSDLSLSEKYAIIDLLAVDQRGTIRKMYTMGATVNSNSKLKSKQLTLEHEITVKDMVSYLKAYAKNKNKTQAKKVLNEILDQAKVHVLPKKIDKILNSQGLKSKGGRTRYQNKKVAEYLKSISKDLEFAPTKLKEVKDLNTLGNAIRFSRSTKNPTKGITVLDFDDTLATSKSLVKFTRPDGSKGTLTPEQYAATYEDLSDLGYEFDFSEFSKVVDGKPAPLLNKAKKLASKFSTKDMFVLTARPADSAPAIREFLKQNGLDIPLKNITGLGNSTAEAKALWVADKVADGYNDFYFADDALKNVQAVQNMLDQFDVKSKVQQARIKFSRSMNDEFNQMLERTKGVPFEEAFSRARALKLGKNKGNFQIFVPPSADDFEGLLYYFVGKGEQGNKDLEFFKQALIDPFSRAYTELDQSRQTIINDWNNLRKKHSEVANKLGDMMPNSEFTFDNAIRVYLYNKAGHDIPGLSEQEVNSMVERVKTDRALLAFAENLQVILKLDDVYVKPNEYWTGGSTASDVQEVSERIRRAEFLTEFVENKNEIFSEENLNKIEATYGSRFRSALEDVLYRMETGRTRSEGSADAISNKWMRWLNNSVGAIMFLNVKSALLQTISTVNYVNYTDNNPLQAARAFANQKQYWQDFTMIFNSDFLKQRRKGLKTDVQTAEIASAVAGAANKAQAAVAYLLKKGFLPTQIADSFAISAGGATFYRNRYKSYIKQGLSETEAKEKAFNDFRNSTEESQQSSRPDRISQQQVSNAGRLLLNFQNYPMQQARIFKKAILGLSRGTGDAKQHLARIAFYGFAQNMIFLSLQNALFAMLFDHEDEEEEQKLFDTKIERILNGMVDTMLRGSGIAGGVIATLKNTMLKAIQELEKGPRANEANIILEAVNISPAIGSKVRKINKGFRTYKWNNDAINEMSKLDLRNPLWTTAAPVIEGVTNIPTDRAIRKINNMREAFDDQNSRYQRLAVMLGYSPYELGIDPDKEVKEAKKEGKRKDKEEKEGKKVRCRAFTSSGGRCKNMTTNKSGLCYAHD